MMQKRVARTTKLGCLCSYRKKGLGRCYGEYIRNVTNAKRNDDENITDPSLPKNVSDRLGKENIYI